MQSIYIGGAGAASITNQEDTLENRMAFSSIVGKIMFHFLVAFVCC